MQKWLKVIDQPINDKMKKITILVVIMFALTVTAKTQNASINKDVINKTVKLIGDSLPDGWTANTDTAYPDEIIIRSLKMALQPDMTSNDPPNPKGVCEIFILIVPKIAPESILRLQKKNEALRAGLPPQVSKNNLQAWYAENDKTLKILDAEPTHYDSNYSYRIKCRRLPEQEADLLKYNSIMSYLNRQYQKY